MKTVKDLCKEYGYSQTGLAKRFGIPLRTVQNWHGGQREPAPYVVPMMEEILRREKAGGIYLIYRDSMDDYATIEGYAIGAEEADRYCSEHNKACRYEYEELTWEKLEELKTDK